MLSRVRRGRISRRALLHRGLSTSLGAAALGIGVPVAARRASAQIYVPGSQQPSLYAGWNAVPWLGPAVAAEEALRDLPLVVAYQRDNDEGTWRSYRPESSVNELREIGYTMPLWLQLHRGGDWQQQPEPPGLPDNVLLPGGWSFVSWTGDDVPVWTVFGETTASPIVQAVRWNAAEQRHYAYIPSVAALEEFAILHGGDAIWLNIDVPSQTWNPALGLGIDPVEPGVFQGQATFFWSGLQGQTMYCGGSYDRHDPTIAATTSWPCGTRLRIWRGERSVDVVVQDRGALGPYHIDLSEAAFQRIADLAEGHIDVLIEPLL